MNSLALLWSRLRWVGLASGSFMAWAAVSNPPQLAVHLKFEQGAGTTQAACNFRGNPVTIAAPALERRFGYPFAGRIREVRIYRGVLAADDIAALYSQAPPE